GGDARLAKDVEAGGEEQFRVPGLAQPIDDEPGGKAAPRSHAKDRDSDRSRAAADLEEPVAVEWIVGESPVEVGAVATDEHRIVRGAGFPDLVGRLGEPIHLDESDGIEAEQPCRAPVENAENAGGERRHHSTRQREPPRAESIDVERPDVEGHRPEVAGALAAHQSFCWRSHVEREREAGLRDASPVERGADSTLLRGRVDHEIRDPVRRLLPRSVLEPHETRADLAFDAPCAHVQEERPPSFCRERVPLVLPGDVPIVRKRGPHRRRENAERSQIFPLEARDSVCAFRREIFRHRRIIEGTSECPQSGERTLRRPTSEAIREKRFQAVSLSKTSVPCRWMAGTMPPALASAWMIRDGSAAAKVFPERATRPRARSTSISTPSCARS